MAISDKTRKTLWAKSGNRCSICRIELVQDENKPDGEFIIGEECHIVSPKEKGPRGKYQLSYDYNHYDNMILLCANHHQMIDKKFDIYTVDKLKTIKKDHENWVYSTLEKDIMEFTNEKTNIIILPKITSGKKIIDIIRNPDCINFGYDELFRDEEAIIIGGFLDELKEYADNFSLIGYEEISKFGIWCNEKIKTLNQNGFFLFGLKRKTKFSFTIANKNSEVTLYYSSFYVARQENPSIVGDFLITKFPSQIHFS